MSNTKKKTLADLKRDAASGKVAFELIERFGKTGDEIPEQLRGIRRVQAVNTVSIYLVNYNGQVSCFDYNPASLLKYTNDTLTVYSAGERPLTDKEKNILNLWKKVENEYEKLNPYSDVYWKKKTFFYDEYPKYRYLAGFEKCCGKRYRCNSNTVFDDRIKGKAILKYKIHHLKENN